MRTSRWTVRVAGALLTALAVATIIAAPDPVPAGVATLRVTGEPDVGALVSPARALLVALLLAGVVLRRHEDKRDAP